MTPLLFLLAFAPTFDSTVGPYVKKNCAMCHNARLQEGGVNLLAFKSAADVTAKRDIWETVVRKIESGEMPPAPLPKPPIQQSKAITHWVEQHFAQLDKNAKPDPGRVTARRLNRMEYNNTIRDLLAIDFKPADDFPADDSGYGFDNIGDVLSLSPVLMEKYLTAAEQITRRAINTEPLPKPSKVSFGAGRMKNRRANYLEITHVFPAAGTYELQGFVTGSKAGGPEWKTNLTFTVDNASPTSLETTMGTDRPRSTTYKADIKTPGVHKLRVEFDSTLIPNSADEVNDKTITQFTMLMDRLEVRGPYDPYRVIPDTQRRLITCQPTTPDCDKQILTRFARRAWRRPVTAFEAQALTNIAIKAREAGDTFEQSLQAAMQAILVSPHFLFRIERGTRKLDAEGLESITDLELASRLSYFLWSSTPDETLLALAEQNNLRKPATLEAQVRRMLADPKADALADGFAGQWLEYRNLDLVRPDPERFPSWTPQLKSAMQEETRRFFLDLTRTNSSIMNLIDAKYTYLNETLAKHYGIPNITGPDFRKVTLPDGRRGGILSMASVLTVSSYPTRTSPVLRGKWVLENVLNAPPPPPPPDVQLLDEKTVGTKMSMREQLKLHRTNATCASCHARMDVLGFGLENYDAIGAWRTKDGTFALDSSGTLPSGQSFSGPEQLKQILAANPQPFAECFTEKLLTFALGRGIERTDRRNIAAIVKAATASQFRLQTFIVEIVKSAPFQKRRPEAPKS
jgi:hypothetical protein